MANQDLLNLLSTAQGKADQGPNRNLAEKLISNQDQQGLAYLISCLDREAGIRIKTDILLCLSHLSALAPEMLVPHVNKVFPFLESKHNRAVWATMITLSNMTSLISDQLYAHLPLIVDRIEHGTVVTKDHGMVILIGLYQIPVYREDAFELFCEQLINAPDNQLGQYGEKIFEVLRAEDTPKVVGILQQRLPELVKDSHIHRIQKLIRRIQKFNF
ncbi:hypothetical protein [Fulvivirga sedimenti]|uniref:Uncharacterized protein n=1 Tax=Fulvivirga sedimenti TaxID=2879465 RepID=A0A9X1HLJ8_9BACT|nr:hypothetical protein [Fulvivirga sedimenti]MCA6074121.1 hypothetical protein [Fulvivirga sedimenti]